MALSRKEIEKDGVRHTELMKLSARAAGMLFLPDNYNGWEVEQISVVINSHAYNYCTCM